MAFSLEAAGAGASQGLDEFLQRALMEQQVEQRGNAQREDVRHNQATEALTGRSLDELAGQRSATEALSRERVSGMEQATAAEKHRVELEDAALADPKTPDAIKQFIGLRRITKQGESVPWEVIPSLKTTPDKNLEKVTIDLPGVGTSLPAMQHPVTGAIMYNGKDVTAKEGKPWAVVHHEPATQILPTDSGFMRAPRAGGNATPVTGTDGKPIMPQSPAQIRTRVDTSKKVEQIIPDIESGAEAVNAMGLMGPIGGRWGDFAAGKWGSAADLKLLGYNLTPEQEQTLNEFRTDLGFLKSGTAMVHGGARGGGSAQIMSRMDQLINANKMDYNGFKGSLKSFKKLLAKYSSLGEDGPVDEKTGGDDLFTQYQNRKR